ncbi:hypothetical protein M427DRAFT_66674 [Gonapodya prolifera JEL478]|uniref:Uncharacterized protein n=1 Tax=Gonapodya prolifera (strain JEL478) TaxID=1344416 RepID=A0A139ATN8_GONPJ|nr:hypothetical protein M427DRAFT_66674 [Gonapodya prolifera JEL478]|eukprot:KXS20096.1 hypothetical protein M427DRAFT_66674 [Gonapodya prolifera JEL478]
MSFNGNLPEDWSGGRMSWSRPRVQSRDQSRPMSGVQDGRERRRFTGGVGTGDLPDPSSMVLGSRGGNMRLSTTGIQTNTAPPATLLQREPSFGTQRAGDGDTSVSSGAAARNPLELQRLPRTRLTNFEHSYSKAEERISRAHRKAQSKDRKGRSRKDTTDVDGSIVDDASSALDSSSAQVNLLLKIVVRFLDDLSRALVTYLKACSYEQVAKSLVQSENGGLHRRRSSITSATPSVPTVKGLPPLPTKSAAGTSGGIEVLASFNRLDSSLCCYLALLQHRDTLLSEAAYEVGTLEEDALMLKTLMPVPAPQNEKKYDRRNENLESSHPKPLRKNKKLNTLRRKRWEKARLYSMSSDSDSDTEEDEWPESEDENEDNVDKIILPTIRSEAIDLSKIPNTDSEKHRRMALRLRWRLMWAALEIMEERTQWLVDEHEDYEENKVSFEEQRESLRHQWVQEQERNQTLGESLNLAENEVLTLTEKLKVLDQRISMEQQPQSQAGDVSSEVIRRMDEELEGLRSRAKDALVSSLYNTINELQISQKSTQDAMTRLEEERANLQQACEELQHEVAKVRLLHESSREQVARVKAEMYDLVAERDSLEERFDEAEEHLASARDECEQLRNDLRAALNQVEDVKREAMDTVKSAKLEAQEARTMAERLLQFPEDRLDYPISDIEAGLATAVVTSPSDMPRSFHDPAIHVVQQYLRPIQEQVSPPGSAIRVGSAKSWARNKAGAPDNVGMARGRERHVLAESDTKFPYREVPSSPSSSLPLKDDIDGGWGPRRSVGFAGAKSRPKTAR